MFQLFGLFYSLFICALVFNTGECMLRRNFESRLRICKLNCGFRGASWSGNSVQTCLLLLDHGNITATECVARCLERKGESLSNAIECQCRLGKCITTSTDAPTTPPLTTAAPTTPPSTTAAPALSGPVAPAAPAAPANPPAAPANPPAAPANPPAP